MRVAVYTICKNEKAFIDRWLQSCYEADEILIVDTGSTDDTGSYLNKILASREYPNLKVVNLTLSPWRFDDARNFSLNLLSPNVNVCVCLDMDELLTDGWREVIEAEWEEGLDRLRYNYVWSWNDDKPGVTYYADKIHARHGLRWVNPVHEVLQKDMRLAPEQQKFINNTLIEHYPDNSKSRSSYFPLLALSVKERPHDDRSAHYYARELFFHEHYDEAIAEFERHLALPTALWNAERSASMRYMGDCHWAKGDYNRAVFFFESAIMEAPNEREPLVAAAQAYRALGEFDKVKTLCKRALQITERPNSYICQPNAWSSWPEEMLQEALYKLSNN